MSTPPPTILIQKYWALLWKCWRLKVKYPVTPPPTAVVCTEPKRQTAGTDLRGFNRSTKIVDKCFSVCYLSFRILKINSSWECDPPLIVLDFCLNVSAHLFAFVKSDPQTMSQWNWIYHNQNRETFGKQDRDWIIITYQMSYWLTDVSIHWSDKTQR